MKRRSGFAPINLVDVQCANGDLFYWSDFNGVFPTRLGAGPTAQYSCWVEKVGPFSLTRSLKVDAGQIVVQNITGAVNRDVSQVIIRREFIGALVVYRWWKIEIEAALWEFHGSVKSPRLSEASLILPLKQLLDTSQQDGLRLYSEQCSLRYKGPMCASVSGLATCDLTFGNCQARGVQERFDGLPFATPGAAQIPSSPFPSGNPSPGPGDLTDPQARAIRGRAVR
jgi:hypothetical protein